MFLLWSNFEALKAQNGVTVLGQAAEAGQTSRARNGIVFHDGVACFLYVVRRAKHVSTGTGNAGDFVLHGFEQQVKGVLLLGELTDPAGTSALEEHSDIIGVVLKVISGGKGIERPACGLFGAVLRV